MTARRWVAIAALATLALTGCSSSGDSPGTTAPPSSALRAASDPAGPVQVYLAAVNALCDDLLPKVLQSLDGGHSDVYPVATFFAEQPAHTALLAGFDAALAKVPVPPAADDKAAAFAAYVRFANQLDAKRLAAAKQGQAAFDKEIRAENVSAASDPSITARTAAGFNDSCNAR
jgi:hypothetical protein